VLLFYGPIPSSCCWWGACT